LLRIELEEIGHVSTRDNESMPRRHWIGIWQGDRVRITEQGLATCDLSAEGTSTIHD